MNKYIYIYIYIYTDGMEILHNIQLTGSARQPGNEESQQVKQDSVSASSI